LIPPELCSGTTVGGERGKDVFLAFVCAFSVCPCARASLITYGTRAAFDAAVGGQTLLTFEPQNPGGPSGVVYYGANLTLGPVSFTQGDARLFVVGQNHYGTAGLSSSYLNDNDGPQDVIINFAGGGIHGLGMDIGQLSPWRGPIGSLALTLSSGDVINVTGLQQRRARSTRNSSGCACADPGGNELRRRVTPQLAW
jgi:hypothetical protein